MVQLHMLGKTDPPSVNQASGHRQEVTSVEKDIRVWDHYPSQGQVGIAWDYGSRRVASLEVNEGKNQGF